MHQEHLSDSCPFFGCSGAGAGGATNAACGARGADDDVEGGADDDVDGAAETGLPTSSSGMPWQYATNFCTRQYLYYFIYCTLATLVI